MNIAMLRDLEVLALNVVNLIHYFLITILALKAHLDLALKI